MAQGQDKVINTWYRLEVCTTWFSLNHMLTGGALMFPEFETLLCKAAYLING